MEQDTRDLSNAHQITRQELWRIALISIAIPVCWLRVFEPLPQFDVVAFAVTLIGGYPIFKEAIFNLCQRRMTMELSMSIALFAALSISEAFTALVIVWFVLIAEVLEKMTMSRGRNAIQDLLNLLPQDVYIRNNNAVEKCKLSQVQIGDVVVIKPGAQVPVDGKVVSGHSYIDQANITGESMPSEKTAGSSVYAGTINQSGTLDVQTTCIGQDTAFGKIVYAVEHAERFKAPVEKTADRLAGYLVYFALSCALLTFLITHNLRSTISVVLVAGACGVAAGTPLAILGAIGRAARAGSIIKGGLYLERLGDVDTVVFDKTGTLTLGMPEVVGIDSLNGVPAEDILQLAATAESASEHPLGKAIVRNAQEKKLPITRPDQFTYLPGRGIICQLSHQEIIVGNRELFEQKNISLEKLKPGKSSASEVLVGISGKLQGVIHIADVTRNEANKVLADLNKMGIECILLSGDTQPVSQSIGTKLGMDKIVADALPADKQEYIRALTKTGKHVAMVGDGINDAPALMQASVGIAIGSGTDIARECANMVLIGSDLNHLVDTIKIAKWCKRIIMTNFIGTLSVDVLGISLAALGYLNPLLAAFIHVTSELVFIMNSARLLPIGVQADSHIARANAEC